MSLGSRLPESDIVEPVRLVAILGLRDEYRREMACPIVHDSWHARGFTDSYLLRAGMFPCARIVRGRIEL